MASDMVMEVKFMKELKFKIKLKNVMKKMIEIPLWNKINADQDILIIKKQIGNYFYSKFSLENKKLEYI